MRIKIFFVALLATFFVFNTNSHAQKAAVITDTVLMNPGYTHEVYYSLTSGTKASVLRNQWDIAFRTAILSASIITNDGSGVVLYTYPKSDTSGWNALDTAGINNWKKLYNSGADWEMGAFNTHTKGQFDYGWGVYNVVTHNLTGDSIYVVKLRNGQFVKLIISGKASAQNKYTIKYANLDGQGEKQSVIDCAPFTSRNFLGYSISDSKVIDFETIDANSWDLLFTKYMYKYPDGTPYNVTGVLSNYNTGVNKFHPVAPDFRLWSAETMDSSRTAIGYDWKYLDNSFAYHIVDSLVYFVQDKSGNIHKLAFKEFSGSAKGRIVLEREAISAAGKNENKYFALQATVYPNPVQDFVNLIINPEKVSELHVSISDISGRQVFSAYYPVQPEMLNTIQIHSSGLPTGVYMFKAQAKDKVYFQKIVKH